VLNISSVAFNLGPLDIHWYAIFIIFGMILGTFLASLEARREGLSTSDVFDFVLYALPISILGARAYYIIFNFSKYCDHPSEIFAIWHGGLAIYGGLITGVICLFVFCKKRELPIFLFLDVGSPSVLLAQAIGRWGNFTNQEAYGLETTQYFLSSTLHLPALIVKGMEIQGLYYQPTFLYESAWSFLGFFLILCLRHRKNIYLEGEIFWQYVAWYSLGRFFIEGLRTDSLMIFGYFRISQILSIIFFFLAIIFIVIRRKKKDVPLYYKALK
jgi:phosphatidylglycerol:prolipoprotein diacylglycerol transferase